MFDEDRYYTPVELAADFISDHVVEAPRTCVDSTCGTGNLLRAASSRFEGLACFGLDRDRNVINALRRKEPAWILSVGDILRPTSYARTSVLASGDLCDLLVLNPPFSHNGHKYSFVDFDSRRTKASTAMAHVLRALDVFLPRLGAVVIAPESLLFSETDEQARALLSNKYDFRSVYEVPVHTFKGTRARAAVLRLTPNVESQPTAEIEGSAVRLTEATIIRGSLPVHSFKEDEVGIPFVHSTDIMKLRHTSSLCDLRRTNSSAKGRVVGWLILLPRVGVPKRASIAVVKVEKPVHLSDCVIALKSSSRSKARLLRKLILASWSDFIGLYRGTGARYVTIARLKCWLEKSGVSVTNGDLGQQQQSGNAAIGT